MGAALPEQAAGAPGNCAARGIHLDAAALAAAAQRAAKVDAHVAAFAAAAGPSLVNLSFAYDRRAYAGSEAHVKNTFIFSACAPFCFGKSGGTGIVGEPRGQAVMFFELSRQGETFPARQVRGPEQDSLLAFHPSGSAHAYGAYSGGARMRHHAIHRLQHGAKSLFGAAARDHRSAAGMVNLAA